MRKISKYTAAAVLAFGLGGTAFAQGQPPAGAQHDGHHPGAPAGAPQPAPGSGAPSPGMAGPGGMMQQMMQRRMAEAAMQPFRRIEGQLAYFRAELRVTEAQTSQWNAFAEAIRTQSEKLRQATQQAMAGSASSNSALNQMERRIALLSAHLEAMRAIAPAANPLYEALSEEQRRTADELMAEHFRSMRMP